MVGNQVGYNIWWIAGKSSTIENYIYYDTICITMKAVRINTKLRDMLKDYSDINLPYDAIINRLIHEVSDYMPLVESDDRNININLHEDTTDKLKAYALTKGESYENILIRMLIISQSLNSNSE